jgi:Tol biopolymer transport system component
MKRVLIACAVLMFAAGPTLAGAAVDDTGLVSRADGPAGEAANGGTHAHPAVSADGRFVAFVSSADNLSDADNDSVKNLFLRDTLNGTTTLVSRATGVGGVSADADSLRPSISSDGRYVAFVSAATNLSDEDDPPSGPTVSDIFVRDSQTQTTTLVSRRDGLAGVAGAADSDHPSISDSGTKIAFHSAADNLSDEDTDSTFDVFLRDTAAGTTTLISRQHATGIAANGNSLRPSISGNGQRIAFESDADNLSPDDVDSVMNIFVRDPRLRSTWLASRTTSTGFVSYGADATSKEAALSEDGSVVVFTSLARNLSAVNAAQPVTQIFKRELQPERTTLVSRAGGVDGAPAEGASVRGRVSQDGRYVTFASHADNLSEQDGPSVDVFVSDTVDKRTALVSRATGSSGAAADGGSFGQVLSSDGLHVVFLSNANNLSPEDNDAYLNLFMREIAPGLPEVVVGPDLGNNEHGGHGGDPGAHSGADHSAAGHDPAHGGAGSGHGHTPSNVRLRGGILFASKTQDIDKLFVFVTIHEPGRIVLEGGVRMPGRASRSYRFKPVKRKLQPHLLRKMRLKLSRHGLRTVKRALKHRRLRARIKLTAVSDSGKRQIVRRTIRLRP